MFLLVQGTRYKVPGTRYQVQGTRYKVQGTRYKVQGTWNLKWHEISKDMKSQMTSNLNPTPHISKFLRYSEFCYTGEFSAKDFFKTKQKWVLFIHYYVNCHELLMFMKCQMSNVECGMFTVHNCALLFTTVHKYSLFTTVQNCSQLFTVHRSQLTVHNCALFVCFLRTGVPIKEVLFVCLFVCSECRCANCLFVCLFVGLFLKDRCTN